MTAIAAQERPAVVAAGAYATAHEVASTTGTARSIHKRERRNHNIRTRPRALPPLPRIRHTCLRPRQIRHNQACRRGCRSRRGDCHPRPAITIASAAVLSPFEENCRKRPTECSARREADQMVAASLGRKPARRSSFHVTTIAPARAPVILLRGAARHARRTPCASPRASGRQSSSRSGSGSVDRVRP